MIDTTQSNQQENESVEQTDQSAHYQENERLNEGYQMINATGKRMIEEMKAMFESNMEKKQMISRLTEMFIEATAD